MKRVCSAILLTITTTLYAQSSGQELFKAKCSMCHIPARPADISKLVAPPAMGIVHHVKMAHPDREGFKAFIKDYVINPSLDKALCAKETIKRFNIMPSQKENVTSDELDKIADYLYDNFGQQGMGCQRAKRGMHHMNMHHMGM